MVMAIRQAQNGSMLVRKHRTGLTQRHHDHLQLPERVACGKGNRHHKRTVGQRRQLRPLAKNHPEYAQLVLQRIVGMIADPLNHKRHET